MKLRTISEDIEHALNMHPFKASGGLLLIVGVNVYKGICEENGVHHIRQYYEVPLAVSMQMEPDTYLITHHNHEKL